jgi:ATP-dependent Clp protease ATP-binding subunit ClpC
MPKINVYLPEELAAAVRDAQLPVSAVCQAALERAVRDVTSARATDEPPADERSGLGLFGRFTGRARAVVQLAQEAARAVPHDYVGTEHLVLGLLDEGGNLALDVLAAVDIDAEDLRSELLATMPKPTKRVTGHIPFTPRAKRVLELTAKEALGLGHNYIGTEHILLGVLAVDDGIGSQVLRRMGLEHRTTRRAVATALMQSRRADRLEPGVAPAAESAFERILGRLDSIERRLDGAA